MVRVENENQVELSPGSSLAGAKLGRVKKANLKGKAKKEQKKVEDAGEADE
jgi:hypothetical protein